MANRRRKNRKKRDFTPKKVAAKNEAASWNLKLQEARWKRKRDELFR